MDQGRPWFDVDVRALWASGETVYFATPYAFGRVTLGGEPELIREWPGRDVEVLELAGIASTGEVFLLLSDERNLHYRCGRLVLLWFDGTELRRF